MTGRDSETASGSAELASVTVGEAMHAGILSCAPEASLRDVAGLMARNRVHMIAVREGGSGRDEQTVWGVVSDLDLVGAALGGDLDGATAGGAAVSPLLQVTPGESLERAAQLMSEHEATHLIVVEPGSERPAGVLSTLDVARALAAAAQ